MIEQLILLAFFLLSGYLLVRLGLAKPHDYKPLANFVFYICLPASILYSFQGIILSAAIYSLLGLLAASMLLSVACSLILSKLLGLERNMLHMLLLCGFFGNITFLGFPFTELLFGSGSMPVAGAYVSVYNLFIFLLILPFIYARLGKGGAENGIMKAIMNPVVACTFFGALSIALSLDLSFALPYLKGFSALTTPLSLAAMGIFLAGSFTIRLDRNMLAIAVSKCLIFPLLTAGLLIAAGHWEAGREMLLLSLMPVAISNFVIADSLDLGLDSLVLGSIVLTTLVSTALVFILALIGVF